jgi:ribonuclease E
MVTPEPVTPEALKDKPIIEQAAVTGVSPAAPAPVITAEAKPKEEPVVVVKEKKPNLLKRLFNVLTGKAADEPDAEVVAEVEPKVEDKPARDQNRRPRNRNNNNNNNRRGPRGRPDQDNSEQTTATPAKTADNSNAQPRPVAPVAAAATAPTSSNEDDEQSATRNPNAKRARRGGRRRRPAGAGTGASRPDGEANVLQTEVTIPDDAGNKLPPEKKEVEGNLIPKEAPEVNGNVPRQEAKEIDGNKPTEDAKPRRGRAAPTAGNPRRRRAPANMNESRATPTPAAEAPVESVAKKPAVTDNAEVKVKVVRPKRIVKEVKPKEDASES